MSGLQALIVQKRMANQKKHAREEVVSKMVAGGDLRGECPSRSEDKS